MGSKFSLSESQRKNRSAWESYAKSFEHPGEVNWRSKNPVWGLWRIPESEVNLLPDDLSGMSCLEIGCGTGYVSAWMKQRNGRVIGIDPSINQLRTAQRLNEEYQKGIRLVYGFGESLPFRSDSFDFAISEYGAALWADPYQWIPETARVLRSGGRLVLWTNHFLNVITLSDDEDVGQTMELLRPYLDLYQVRWVDDEDTVEYYLPHGRWIELFRENGLEVERLLELGAPKHGTTDYVDWADSEWGQKWPIEEAWTLVKK